uniref:Uncharacterized protein n=1 Tax=Oreochromis aureus TaxID=47969 RepID=A0AAZ1XW26_OREAU
MSSWDDPLGFLERKREVLMDKRSYSDSDLSKITGSELNPYCTTALGDEKHWCLPERMRADLRPVSPVFGGLSSGYQTTKKETHILNIPVSSMRTNSSCAKQSKCKAKKALPKYSSNVELCRNPHNLGPTSTARPVAKAMAEQGPPGETVLQRSALLQEELNSSECGWALLVTESDPHVLCCLLWTWLEKLREPVLSAEDIERLSIRASNRNPLSVLKKPQRHTIYCVLSCVSTVTSLCPHREEAVLHRLIRALTRRSQEEMESLAPLMKVMKATLRETFHNYRYFTRACSTNATL